MNRSLTEDELSCSLFTPHTIRVSKDYAPEATRRVLTAVSDA